LFLIKGDITWLEIIFRLCSKKSKFFFSKSIILREGIKDIWQYGIGFFFPSLITEYSVLKYITSILQEAFFYYYYDDDDDDDDDKLHEFEIIMILILYKFNCYKYFYYIFSS
jgi:hypothetical protein